MSKQEPTLDNIAAGFIVIMAILLIMAAFAHGQEVNQQVKVRITASEQNALNVAQDAVDETYARYQEAIKAKNRLEQEIINDHVPGQDYECELNDQYVSCERNKIE